MEPAVTVNKQNNILTMTLNRPQAYNAINQELALGLHKALQQAKDDDDIRVVALTGAGKAFCAGGDVKLFADHMSKDGLPLDLLDNLHSAIKLIRTLPKPVVGLINGAAAGAGLSLALACDLTYVHADAIATTAYTQIGLTPDGGMTYILPKLVGLKKATELIFTSAPIPAQEGLKLGLYTAIIAADSWENTCTNVLEQLAKGATRSFASTKELLHHSFSTDQNSQLQQEERSIIAASNSQDFREGLKAFVDRRQPHFSGQ